MTRRSAEWALLPSAGIASELAAALHSAKRTLLPGSRVTSQLAATLHAAERALPNSRIPSELPPLRAFELASLDSGLVASELLPLFSSADVTKHFVSGGARWGANEAALLTSSQRLKF